VGEKRTHGTQLEVKGQHLPRKGADGTDEVGDDFSLHGIQRHHAVLRP
jgi:hypothetical protein